jgi:hypothetical protein
LHCEAFDGQFGETTTPQGSAPTVTDCTGSSVATSMKVMSLETPLVLMTVFWSGVKASYHTRCPTRIYFSTS